MHSFYLHFSSILLDYKLNLYTDENLYEFQKEWDEQGRCED